VVEEADEIKRGPKGGRKHCPGRDHDKKSHDKKKERISDRLRKKHNARREAQRKKQEEEKQMDPEVKKLLGKPRPPRR
jgi:hypothetical protein